MVLRDGETWNLAWPSPGTVWDAATGKITVNGVGALVGESVSLGGGEMDVSPETLDRFLWVVRPESDCTTRPYWFVYRIT